MQYVRITHVYSETDADPLVLVAPPLRPLEEKGLALGSGLLVKTMRSLLLSLLLGGLKLVDDLLRLLRDLG
ncbi:MAG: hypothetical protein AVDCRST_MAG37-79 [uncultured Rubrobacteraceae bacterium]|uniref:Uncharacterized protein n=1 Tax=uncultured Rubrobacteraceae bacterium TaxID=349277 RepID=A0A6J4PR79_9ACTN|nr:MAG: hypothetical protein AVDCRST_MAG37-79 [uncultured Rubrobacteraceae bacterium]